MNLDVTGCFGDCDNHLTVSLFSWFMAHFSAKRRTTKEGNSQARKEAGKQAGKEEWKPTIYTNNYSQEAFMARAAKTF